MDVNGLSASTFIPQVLLVPSMDPEDSSVIAVEGQSLMEVPCPVDQTPQNCNFDTDDCWRLRLTGVCVCVGRGHFFGSKWRQGWDWSGQFQDLLQDPAGMVRMQMLLLPLVASIAGLFASFGPEMLGPLGPCPSCGPWCPDNVWHGRLGKAERPPFWTFASNPIWVNYNDLTATSLESWLIREIIPKWP